MTRERLEGILHDPLGLEHPYEQGPTERFPRDPLAGDLVRVGALTWPAGASEAVWASWQTEPAGESGEVIGERVHDAAAGTDWSVLLPASEASQRVRYQLHARQGVHQVSSGTFAFFVPHWERAGDLTGCRFSAQGLECTATSPGLQYSLSVDLHRPHAVHLRMCARTPGAAGPAEPQLVPDEVPADAAYRLLAQTPGWITVETKAVQLTLHRRPCRLEVRRNDGSKLLGEAEPASWLIGEGGQVLRICQTFSSPGGEAFYGFGERYNALDQRGHSLDVRVYDQYKQQGRRTYLPAPFFFSSRGYGLSLRTSRWAEYDLAASREDRWSYQAEVGPEGELEADLIVADDPKAILSTYAGLTARPSLPPIWAFGPWMSGNEWNSQAKAMEQVARTMENAIPATVLVLEAWSDEATFYIWNDAQYSSLPSDIPPSLRDFRFPPEGKWPDPKGMIDELHRLGIRVLLWQIPVLKKLEVPHPQRDADEAHVLENGYCVREASGEPYRIRPGWFKDGLVLDFTHPAATAWWLSKRTYLLDELGVDGFKTDGGEHQWGRGLRFADGRRGDELCNLYPNLYVGAYHRFAAEKREGDAVTFSRAGFAGAQAFPLHWAGDEDSTWEAFRATILAGLNAGLSGIPFWGWDLAGFGGEVPSAELYLRAAAMAAFCPVMQYHSEYNEHRLPCRDRTPWNIAAHTGDEEVIPIFRKFARVRMNLLPYIYSEAWKCSQTGIPLMRPLLVDFADDLRCREFPYQYLFGDRLLVAPVVQEGCLRWPVYLPAGVWYDLWTGESFVGPKVLDRRTPKDTIPVYVKRGGFLPLNLGVGFTLPSDVGNAVDCYRNLCFWLYPMGAASEDWYDGLSSRSHRLECEMPPEGTRALVRVPATGHDTCLAVMDCSPSNVRINGQDLDPVRDFRHWQHLSREGWCLAPDREVAWVRIPKALGRAEVELL